MVIHDVEKVVGHWLEGCREDQDAAQKLQEGKTKAVVSEELLKKLSIRTDFNLSGRCREEKEKIKYQMNEDFAETWFAHAEEIHQWLTQYLKQS